MALDLSPAATVIRSLQPADLDAAVAVENAAFTNPHHRATPDKIAYRLAVCPELCFGVFARVAAGTAAGPAGLVANSRGEVLVAHIIATRGRDPVVTDANMAYPKDWRAAGDRSGDATDATGTPIGHLPDGTTVGVHSLAVVPAAQRSGVGSRLVGAYLAQMATTTAVARVALICQDYLVDYYKKLGFALVGPSEAQFGGGGWYDMVYDVSRA